MAMWTGRSSLNGYFVPLSKPDVAAMSRKAFIFSTFNRRRICTRLLTQEEAAERFEDEDKDGDGKVTWNEHVSEAFGSGRDEEEDDLRLLEEDDRYFKAADVNKDGSLDKEEFPKFSHPSEFPEMQDILYDETMKKKDRDGDGFLNLEEFTSEDPDKPLNSEQFLAEKERFEMDYDKNGDKKLDREEILNWLLPGNE